MMSVGIMDALKTHFIAFTSTSFAVLEFDDWIAHTRSTGLYSGQERLKIKCGPFLFKTCFF